MKYSLFIDNDEVAYVGKDQFEVITYSNGTKCLLARVSTSPIDFIKEFVERLSGDVFLLYILKVQRTYEWEPARYQSPLLSKEATIDFLNRFGDFLAGDGRHDFWMYWPEQLQLIYDQHERFYLYGHIESLRSALLGLGFKEEPVEQISTPHHHYFNEEFDGDLDAMMKLYQWVPTPLSEMDEE